MLSRGDDFVFAQNIAQVVAFLKLNEKAGPVLTPAQLVERMERYIDAALRIVPQMPDDQLGTLTPNRPRSYGRLAHHMFRICEAFTEVAGGKFFDQGLPGEVKNPEEMASTAALADYGRRVKAAVEAISAGLRTSPGRPLEKNLPPATSVNASQMRNIWCARRP